MKKEKVDSILNTARHMFGRYGLQKTNLGDIARLSKVAKATIYNYFGSKERVYVEVLNREVNDIADCISAAVEQAKSPRDRLRAFIFTTFNLVKENAAVLNLQAETPHRLIVDGDRVRKNLFSRQTTILQNILKDGVKEGIFTKCDLQTTHSILYAMRGFEVTCLTDPDNAEIEATLDRLFNIVCSGIMNTKRLPSV